MIDSKPTVEELKEEIDDLRRTWDYLDKKGSREAKQRIIMNQIEHVQKLLKGLYDEEY